MARIAGIDLPKGKRIEINDLERIKSGEQVKLKKQSNYKENFEKFSNEKLGGK